MQFATRTIALCALILAATAGNAAVHQFSTCHLLEGKTGADAAAILNETMKFNGDNVEASYTILWPFYGNERQNGTFVIHYQFESFDNFGGALGWIWDEKNFEREEAPNQDAVFTCSQHQVAWEYPEEQ